MKIFGLLLLAALASGTPNQESIDISPSNNVQVLVNGVGKGEALEIGHILDLHLNEKSADAVTTSNLLQPLSAVAIAEAAAAEAAAVETAQVEAEIPASISLPEASAPALETVVPEPIVLPILTMDGNTNTVVETVVLPEPISLPEAVAPVAETIVPESIVLPVATNPVEEPVIPEPVVLPAAPEPVVEQAIPESVVLPAAPEAAIEVVIPESVVLPAPPAPAVEVAVPESVVLPAAPAPAVEVAVPESIVLPAAPEPAIEEAIPVPVSPVEGVVSHDIFNDGVVQVTMNTPADQGVLATVSSWVNVVFNYVNGAITYTQNLF